MTRAAGTLEGLRESRRVVEGRGSRWEYVQRLLRREDDDAAAVEVVMVKGTSDTTSHASEVYHGPPSSVSSGGWSFWL